LIAARKYKAEVNLSRLRRKQGVWMMEINVRAENMTQQKHICSQPPKAKTFAL
jgi:hypothetical protein